MHVDPCRGTIYFPASLQNSLESACKDSNHRSETLNKCEEATPIKTGNRVFNVTQGLRRKSGVTWKTEGIGMHGWSELKKILLPLQAMRKLKERKHSGPMVTFNSEPSVDSLPALKPLTTVMRISQRYASNSQDRLPGLSMAVILNCAHTVYSNTAWYRFVNAAVWLQMSTRGIAHLSSAHYN